MKYPLVPLVSISMGSQASEDHEEDPGHCDELLYTSSSSADVCDTAESSVTPVSSRLLSLCHGSSVDFTKVQVIYIAQTPAFPPVKSTNTRFPTTTFSGKTRCFNPLWFNDESQKLM